MSKDLLDKPLVSLSSHDFLSYRMLTRGTFITGGTGSGKSSSVGLLLSRTFLSLNMGGLVCCVKPDEKDIWVSRARAAGREKDLIIVSPESPYRFNFLNYEMKRKNGGGLTRNIVNILMEVKNLGSSEGGSGKSEDKFWDGALKRILYRICLLYTSPSPRDS